MVDEPEEMGRFRKGALALTRTRPFRKLIGPKVIGKVDRWVLTKTKGRWTALGPPMFPTMVLVTTGRRSGEPRPVSLVYVPDDDGAYVVGSNWAREGHPAWSQNLIAEPEATVIAEGAEWKARARLLDDDEKARVWPELVEVMPQWDQ
ncbi:MAG: nitroreductase family deazaflavin-dependent oxidoreductase, partial [Actinomycetota bacterium]